jgi:hypothetical protein
MASVDVLKIQAKLVVPLEAPVTIPTLPSSGRWLALLPRLVEAVRTCDGLADMVKAVADNVPIALKDVQSEAGTMREQLSWMVGLRRSSSI